MWEHQGALGVGVGVGTFELAGDVVGIGSVGVQQG